MPQHTVLDPAKSFAILMGMSEYAHFTHIPPVKKNLDDLEALLLDAAVFGLPQDQVRRIQDKTSTEAIKQLRQWAETARAARAQTLLFYYAGHGYRRTDQKFYLTATESDPELINFDGASGISFGDTVQKALREARIPKNIIVLDACYSGAAALNAESPLAAVEALHGSYTLTSSTDKEASWFDEKTCPHTFFTAALLETLRQGIASHEAEHLTLDVLYDRLRQAIKEKGHAMTPWHKATQELSPATFAFCKNAAFDPDQPLAKSLRKDIAESITDLEQGKITKAKRNLEGIQKDLERIRDEALKAELATELRRWTDFCEQYPHYKPVFEKITAADLDQTRTELAAKAQKINQLEADLKDKADLAWQWHTEAKIREQAVDALKSELEQARRHDTTADLSEARADLAAKAQKINQLEADLQMQADLARQRQAEAAEAAQSHRAAVAALEAEIAALKRKLEAARKQQPAPASAPDAPGTRAFRMASFVAVLLVGMGLGAWLLKCQPERDSQRSITAELGPPPGLPDPIRKLEADMVAVAGGTFTMGCQDEKRDGNCYDDEKPPRQVRVRDFAIGRYEVTQAQWRAVMGSDPPELYNKGCDECPVERVSWNDIQNFLKKLNALTGKTYRLPAEAEWEYAARGGAKSRGYLYSGSNNLDEVGWYDANYKQANTFGAQKTTRPVGQKRPNELDLYDMNGNVWEWCQDAWHDNYKGAPTDGRPWMDGGDSSLAVLRGGSWELLVRYCRVAFRSGLDRSDWVNDVGFRLARTAP